MVLSFQNRSYVVTFFKGFSKKVQFLTILQVFNVPFRNFGTEIQQPQMRNEKPNNPKICKGKTVLEHNVNDIRFIFSAKIQAPSLQNVKFG